MPDTSIWLIWTNSIWTEQSIACSFLHTPFEVISCKDSQRGRLFCHEIGYEELPQIRSILSIQAQIRYKPKLSGRGKVYHISNHSNIKKPH